MFPKWGKYLPRAWWLFKDLLPRYSPRSPWSSEGIAQARALRQNDSWRWACATCGIKHFESEFNMLSSEIKEVYVVYNLKTCTTTLRLFISLLTSSASAASKVMYWKSLKVIDKQRFDQLRVFWMVSCPSGEGNLEAVRTIVLRWLICLICQIPFDEMCSSYTFRLLENIHSLQSLMAGALFENQKLKGARCFWFISLHSKQCKAKEIPLDWCRFMTSACSSHTSRKSAKL